MGTTRRAVRPYYVMVEGNEFELNDLVKSIKKKLVDRTIAKEEIKQLEELKKALDVYKKANVK